MMRFFFFLIDRSLDDGLTVKYFCLVIRDELRRSVVIESMKWLVAGCLKAQVFFDMGADCRLLPAHDMWNDDEEYLG